ncbi:tRNA (mnm(5)s(2)U34)-methyltransferase [Clostridium brassicae]|uniref:Methyltransferase domain-containing protein n=1 Tax=Clostridium brassicae TaxID=2999072 RepID=A0ABT4D677_9CLOT|nr:class I SAM-dependent methyltransferase [Clostridium brassicae]MCY6957806.1 methyltransferase domain-containing protein [Clostridium brassicae]
MEKNYLTNALNLGKELCIKKVMKGDIVVDATMGNGNDTVFLAKLVGENGKVYAFDIQKDALENTKEKIIKQNLDKQVQLIKDGHENIDRYVKEEVQLVMFNLGYLPGKDKKVTTKANTTLVAIEKSLNILRKNGVVILIIYHGHEEGKKEKILIEDYIKNLGQKDFNVIELSFVNQINNPPILIAIEKR